MVFHRYHGNLSDEYFKGDSFVDVPKLIDEWEDGGFEALSNDHLSNQIESCQVVCSYFDHEGKLKSMLD
jgi:hypothetical protein